MRYTAPSSKKRSVNDPSAVLDAFSTVKRWDSLSFSSTLYLRPVLDALLAPMPGLLHDELRLGLQEALVNAAKHGNQLDPQKLVSVRYAKADGYYWWIVSDQGNGFAEPIACPCPDGDSYLLDAQMVSDCGRGLYILHQVFDQVRWSNNGKEIQLAKQIKPSPPRFGSVSPVLLVKQFELWLRRWSTASV
ncbi:MAG: ATP-binding protein [Phormidesmis sp.]